MVDQTLNFSSKKWWKCEILSYQWVIYLKRKLSSCIIHFQVEKIGFFKKKNFFFWNLQFLHRRVPPLDIFGDLWYFQQKFENLKNSFSRFHKLVHLQCTVFWIVEIFPGKFSASNFSDLSILENQGWEILKMLLNESSHRKCQNVFENSDPRRSLWSQKQKPMIIPSLWFFYLNFLKGR